MYKKGWCTGKVVVLPSKPIPFLPFSLSSASSLLKLPRIGRGRAKNKVFCETSSIINLSFNRYASATYWENCAWPEHCRQRPFIYPFYLKSTRKHEWTMSKHVIIDLSFSSQPPIRRQLKKTLQWWKASQSMLFSWVMLRWHRNRPN